MQIPQPPRRKSRSRAAVAAAALVSLSLVTATTWAMFEERGALAHRTSSPVAASSVIEGPAVGWAERSLPWLEEVAKAPADRQREQLLELMKLLSSATPETSTRAAILLGALFADERVDELLRAMARAELIGHLEERIDTGSRWSVGADIVAARGLDAPPPPNMLSNGGPPMEERLAALAVGQEPHPNLAVRVECAAAALALNAQFERNAETSKPLTAFLLAVLRAETPDQAKSPRTWPRITTLAWVKTRSAETLARWTGTKNLFRPDGPWAHQMEEANRFESLLK